MSYNLRDASLQPSWDSRRPRIDQRQLPPTNFFGRVSGESDVDEDDDGVANAGDLESILGLCEAQGKRLSQCDLAVRSTTQIYASPS